MFHVLEKLSMIDKIAKVNPLIIRIKNRTFLIISLLWVNSFQGVLYTPQETIQEKY